MKQLKSSFKDLHRIFRQSITAREIAEHLVSFEADHPAPRVKAFMEARGFDVVGVREEGFITGYVEVANLGLGTVGAYKKSFNLSKVLNESDPMLEALEALKDSRWVFIKFLGNPSGIITRGDLQKAPMRMWLFGLITLLEMQMTRKIREQYPNGEWIIYLSPGRQQKAQQTYKDKQIKNENLDILECLYLTDKATIFKKSQPLGNFLNIINKNEWETFMGSLTNELRNNLAHASEIKSTDWPDIALKAKKVEEYLEILEK
jgi:hypothetical protein